MITLGNSFFSSLLHTPSYAGGIAATNGGKSGAFYGRSAQVIC